MNQHPTKSTKRTDIKLPDRQLESADFTQTENHAQKNTGRTKKSQKFLLICNYLLSTYFISYGSELIVGYSMIYLIGLSVFNTPLITAIYTALSYLLVLFLLVILPNILSSKNKTKQNVIQKFVSSWQTNRKELGLVGLPTYTDIALSIIGFAIYAGLSYFILELFTRFSWFQPNQEQATGFSHYLIGTDRIFAFFALVIFAPIFEEVIYRGWLYSKIRKQTNQTFAILLTSVLFGIAHGQWNVGVNVFALSLVLCSLREINGTIYSSILLHMIKNGIAFFYIYVMGI